MSKLVSIPASQYRRLVEMEDKIREVIDGADIEKRMRTANHSRYDAGYFEASYDMANKILAVLPERAPF